METCSEDIVKDAAEGATKAIISSGETWGKKAVGVLVTHLSHSWVLITNFLS